MNNEDVEEEDSEGGRGFVGEKYLVKEKDGEGKKRELLLEKVWPEHILCFRACAF